MDDKREKAVALRYDSEQNVAPVVVAKGKGLIAQRIEEIARESGVPLREDNHLVDYLMSLDLYEEIPPELYAVVAEILAFIYRMDQ
ncbi:MAG: EscU/YscU/HrcU family type III secretion system export apparatus switch protein, partial [Syntrophomonadaceae bacterium]|nr:EscU/YscU/HrcU family type III secretion system export apparatus switch protein [Syntrophomonadaceae bacterium]